MSCVVDELRGCWHTAGEEGGSCCYGKQHRALLGSLFYVVLQVAYLDR